MFTMEARGKMITEQKAEQVAARPRRTSLKSSRTAGKNAGRVMHALLTRHPPAEVLPTLFPQKRTSSSTPYLSRRDGLPAGLFQQGGAVSSCFTSSTATRAPAAAQAFAMARPMPLAPARHGPRHFRKINIHHGQIGPVPTPDANRRFPAHAALSACTSHSGKSPWRGKEVGNGSQRPSPR